MVDTIGRIRRAHFVRGESLKEIARDLRLSRNTHVHIGNNNGYPVPLQCGSAASKAGNGRCSRHKGLIDARENAIRKLADLNE